MDFEKIANYFCDLIHQHSSRKNRMNLIKEMIETRNFSFKEINWCFPLCSKELYYRLMYDIIAQYRDEGLSDEIIMIKILNVSEEDFKKALFYGSEVNNNGL